MKPIISCVMAFCCVLLLSMTTACKSKQSNVWTGSAYGSGTTSSGAGKFGACEAEDLANKSCK